MRRTSSDENINGSVNSPVLTNSKSSPVACCKDPGDTQQASAIFQMKTHDDTTDRKDIDALIVTFRDQIQKADSEINTVNRLFTAVVDVINPACAEDTAKLNTVITSMTDMLERSDKTKEDLAEKTKHLPSARKTLNQTRNNNDFRTITICSNNEADTQELYSVTSSEVSRLLEESYKLKLKVYKQAKMLKNLLMLLQQQRRSLSTDSRSAKNINNHPPNGSNYRSDEQSSTTRRRRKIIETAATLSQRKQQRSSAESPYIHLKEDELRNALCKHISEERNVVKHRLSQDICKPGNNNGSSGYGSLNATHSIIQQQRKSQQKKSTDPCAKISQTVGPMLDGRIGKRSTSGSSGKLSSRHTPTICQDISSNYTFCKGCQLLFDNSFTTEQRKQHILYCYQQQTRRRVDQRQSAYTVKRRQTEEIQTNKECLLYPVTYEGSKKYNQHVTIPRNLLEKDIQNLTIIDINQKQ